LEAGCNLLTLTFEEQINYPDDDRGIILDVVLISDRDNPVSARVILDTGAGYCIFQRNYADLLGIEIERGFRKEFRTANGGFIAFGHEVSLQISTFDITTTVYFVPDEHFPVSVLGRIGFLDRLQIGLFHCEQLLFIDSLENYYQ
jgi:hypothetical protein